MQKKEQNVLEGEALLTTNLNELVRTEEMSWDWILKCSSSLELKRCG